MARVILRGETPQTKQNFLAIAKNFSERELRHVQTKLRQGNLDGHEYRGERNSGRCGCMFGAIASAKLGEELNGFARQGNLACELAIQHNYDCVDGDIEIFLYNVHYGDKPKNSKHALKFDRWLTEAINLPK